MATDSGNGQVKGLGLIDSATGIGRRPQSPGVLLRLSGGYNHLLDYVIFAVLPFYILTIAGLFVLRRTRPDLDRPDRAFGYPALPALYMAAAGLIEVLLLLYKPNYTWPVLIIVLLGLAVYFNWRGKATI